MLKHETVVTIMAVAWLQEGTTWQQKLLDQYKKLRPQDFETRPIAITQLSCKRWPTLSEDIVGRCKHNILPFKELGAVVLLPLSSQAPRGAVTSSLALALQALNDIRSSSTFLRLSQMRSDFGAVVRTIAVSEPELHSSMLDQPVSWHLIQQYYARLNHYFRDTVFEPHVQLEDMVWHPIERTLATIEPSLKFWEGSGHLGMLHGHTPVSLNIVDAALSYCNNLPFEQRISQYFRTSLWSELLLSYFQHHSVEQSVLSELQPSLATELALA